jgi:hypothetical protein
MPSKIGKSTKFVVAGLVFAITASAAIGFLQDARSAGTADTPWPLQVDVRVPFEPTAFSSAGRTHLTYELYLTNFGNAPLTLRRIEVLDASGVAEEPVVAFEGAQLDSLLQPVGAQADGGGKSGQLAAGGCDRCHNENNPCSHGGSVRCSYVGVKDRSFLNGASWGNA